MAPSVPPTEQQPAPDQRYLQAYDELVASLRAAADFHDLLLRELADQRDRKLAGFAPGELLALLRRTRTKSLDSLIAGVYTELAAGRSWADVAQGLNLPEQMARELHEENYRAWCGAPPEPDRPQPAIAAPAPPPSRAWWRKPWRRGRGVSSGEPSRR